jgi:hypothetical protein
MRNVNQSRTVEGGGHRRSILARVADPADQQAAGAPLTAKRRIAFALIATRAEPRWSPVSCRRMNEDWLAVIVGLALLVLVLVGAIPGSVIP